MNMMKILVVMLLLVSITGCSGKQMVDQPVDSAVQDNQPLVDGSPAAVPDVPDQPSEEIIDTAELDELDAEFESAELDSLDADLDELDW